MRTLNNNSRWGSANPSFSDRRKCRTSVSLGSSCWKTEPLLVLVRLGIGGGWECREKGSGEWGIRRLEEGVVKNKDSI